MKDFFAKIVGSLDTKPNNGFSARKLAALTTIVLVVITHIKWFKSDHWEYLGEVLLIDLGFIAMCLGMTTYEAMKKVSQPPTEELPKQ